MSRTSSLRNARPVPHARYGLNTVLGKVPDYVEPFVAYQVWNWTAEGVSSLNGALWTPRVAFEAKCYQSERDLGMVSAAPTDSARKFWQKRVHQVPDPRCTCGTYAGINMQRFIDIHYTERGIHGEVYLWGRLYRHTLGWCAEYGYPKYFVVPPDLLPFSMTDIQEGLKALVAFDVDIYLQRDQTPSVTGEKIPLWVKDYGYSQQGVSFLIEKRTSVRTAGE